MRLSGRTADRGTDMTFAQDFAKNQGQLLITVYVTYCGNIERTSRTLWRGRHVDPPRSAEVH